MGKLAIKKLTASDLTLFEWQFRNANAGNQKSINLNANVFVDRLFNKLPDTDVGKAGRIPLDLFIFGPGMAPALNLQRKIIKGGSYKNWRLNGEFIMNPADMPDRFNVLEPGDYAIFDFEGEFWPTGARMVLVAKNHPDDARLHAGIDDFGINSMEAIEIPNIRMIVHGSGAPEAHPVCELLLDSAIEDAAQGGLEGTQKILGRNTGRRLTRAELARARERADDVGREGEELIDGFFELERSGGRLESFQWISNDNAIAPHDFEMKPRGEDLRRVEVKSTNGPFSQVMHVSIAQLIEMADATVPYDLYRVYALDDRKAKLRVATGLRAVAEGILATLRGLPAGVTVDGVSVKPDSLTFGTETSIELPETEEDVATGNLF